MDGNIIKDDKWSTTTWVVLLLTLLNVLDFTITYYAIENMGAGEANPFLAYMMEITGTIWVILWFKAAWIAFFYGWYIFSQEFYEKCQEPLLQRTFILITGAYTWLVLSNIILITIIT